MKVRDALIEAVNLGRTDSFPVFMKGQPVGRIYLVPSDDIEWLSRGELDESANYAVFVKGIEPSKLTEDNFKYYSDDSGGFINEIDFEDASPEDKERLAASFGRVFGFFDPIRYSRHK